MRLEFDEDGWVTATADNPMEGALLKELQERLRDGFVDARVTTGNNTFAVSWPCLRDLGES